MDTLLPTDAFWEGQLINHSVRRNTQFFFILVCWLLCLVTTPALADRTKRCAVQPPYVFLGMPKGASGFSFTKQTDAPITIIDGFDSLRAEVCNRFGPTNPLMVHAVTSTGIARDVIIRHDSCVQFDVAKLSIAPGCVNASGPTGAGWCAPKTYDMKCDDGSVQHYPIWAGGYWRTVITTPDLDSNLRLSIGELETTANDWPIPFSYGVVAEKPIAVQVCNPSNLHIGNDAFGDQQKEVINFRGCGALKAQSMWIQVE